MGAYENIKERLQLAENMTEGSFGLDNALAVGEELDRIESEVEYLPNRFFPTLAWGDDLTLAAANFGVERKAATAAKAILTIAGTAGTAIDGGIKAAAGDLVFVCGSAVIPSSGTVDVEAVCETAGAAGNVAIGAINEFLDIYEGLESVTNAAAASGGADEESDEDLLIRVKARWQNPSTGGNKADYERWALSVPGVSRALAMNPSAGNVSVYLIASGSTEADSALVASVKQYIESVRPIGASVTVASAAAKVINVAVTATIAEGYTAEGIKADMIAALGDYLAALGLSAGAVSYLRVADILFVDGVTDISAYTLNGDSASIALGSTEFAQLGTVTVNGN